ncbi:hypothetical protein QJQ45_025609, partial [Haematococcus lacustris]
PHLNHLAAASSAGTSLEANLEYITITLTTWEAVWEVYLDPKPRGTAQRPGRVVLMDEHQPGVGPNVVPGSGPTQAPTGPMQQRGSHTASSLRAWPRKPPPAKRSKRTEAEQAAEPNQPTMVKGKGKGKAAKAKPAPQPGRWLDRDRNTALIMQRIGESKWRPFKRCWWPDQAALPAKGKEYPELGYKRLRDQPPKVQQQQQQQQQPAVAQ